MAATFYLLLFLNRHLPVKICMAGGASVNRAKLFTMNDQTLNYEKKPWPLEEGIREEGQADLNKKEYIR
jgi:hypothetical protein